MQKDVEDPQLARKTHQELFSIEVLAAGPRLVGTADQGPFR